MQDLSKQNSDKNPFFPVRIYYLTNEGMVLHIDVVLLLFTEAATNDSEIFVYWMIYFRIFRKYA